MFARETDASGEGRPGKLYCNLCAIWLSSKGAVLKDHVLGKNKKNSAGEWEHQPGSHARKAALQPPPICVEAPPQPNPTIIVNVPRSEPAEPECSPPPAKKQATSKSLLGDMLAKGTADQEFHRDLSLACEFNLTQKCRYPQVQAEACRSMPQHAAACRSTRNFSEGPH